MRFFVKRVVIISMFAIAAAACPKTSSAHGGEDQGASAFIVAPHNWHELWQAWEFEPAVVLPLWLSFCWYACGLQQFWAAAGIGHGIRRWEASCFFGGWLTLVLALVSPLHRWGGVLFSAHMTQHELLMLIAAPLLVLGKPVVAFLKGMPGGWARAVARLANGRAWQAGWRIIVHPFVAWTIHGVVLWVWHIPALFEATLKSDFVHALQHLSFLLSALLFWWAVMHGRNRAVDLGAAVLYMFSTALHSGALAALITFAHLPWYTHYANTSGSWGLTALEDQQLGGLIMWIPACTVYIFAGVALFAGWMQASEARVSRWENEHRSKIA
jgi:putative membrane protein